MMNNKVVQYTYKGLLVAVMAMGLVLPFAQGVDATQLAQQVVNGQVSYTTASPASNSQIAVMYDGVYWSESVPPTGYVSQFGKYSGVWYSIGEQFTLSVPKGAIVSNAYITYTSNLARSNTTVAVKIYAAANSSPAAWSDATDFNGRSVTTNYKDWSMGSWGGVGTTQSSGDMSAVVQEVIDRGDWVSGNTIAILLKDNSSTNYREFQNIVTTPAVLTVVYTYTPSIALTVSTVSSSAVAITTATVSESIATMSGPIKATKHGTQYGTNSTTYGSWDNTTADTTSAPYNWDNNLTLLTAASVYYFRGFATDNQSTPVDRFGSQLSFLTLPDLPTAPLTPAPGNTTVAFTWTNAAGGSGTTISTQVQYKIGSYPTSYSDGTTGIAWSTGTSGTVSGLTNGQLYYFAAFSRAVNGALTQYSTTAIQATSTPGTYATVTTQAVTSIASTTATGNGNVTSDGGSTITERGTVIALGANPTISDTKDIAAGTTGVYTTSIDTLASGTTYHVRAFATNTTGTSYGADVSFTTLGVPVVTTSAAGSVLSTSAVLNGSQTSAAGNCDYQGFVWGIVSRTDPGNVAPASTTYLYNWTQNGVYASGSAFNYTAAVPTGNTLYYFRAVAHNTNGWAYGTELNFTTSLLVTPPVIATAAATNVANVTAQLNASVTDSGGQLTDVRFAYDNVTRASIGDYAYFTTWDNDTYSTGNTPYKNVTGLNISSTYYFRAQVANDNSSTVGAELSFITASGVSCPTYPVAIPSSENISLNWVKGSGSTNTLVRYQTGSYPTAIDQGSTGYTGTMESVQLSGLISGTTYYISLWGLTGGTYSSTYATVISTTTVGVAAAQVLPPSHYVTPLQWFQSPDYTKMSKFPLYDVINWGAGIFKVPLNTSWFTLAFIFCIAIGVMIYRFSTNIPASAGSIAVTIVFCSFMGLMEMWLVVPFVLIALGAWIQGNRA